MDTDVAGYKQSRYDEIGNEMKNMLIRVGWKKEFVEQNTPVLPLSGWMGDNLIAKSANMDWWKGMDVLCQDNKTKVHVDTLLDVLEKMVQLPTRNDAAAMRLPISGCYKIKGVGDVLTGRVEQGKVVPGEEVLFMPTHTGSTPCTGKVFTVEMHHKRVEAAQPGDNVGMNIKGLLKENMPRVGDVMIYKKDDSLKHTKSFTAQIQTLDIPGELKNGYCPIGFVRCGRAACKMISIAFKVGKETGGKKMESPHSLKANEVAQCDFEPQHPLVVDSFKNCEGLSRIAFLDGNTVMMLGKVTATVAKVDEGKKK
jgi:elongation factor 1-alpha